MLLTNVHSTKKQLPSMTAVEHTQVDPQSDVTEIDKDRVIYQLWKIIDDIDTIGDVAKGNDKLYRKFVEQKQRSRFDVIPEPIIDQLYDKYYAQPETFPQYMDSVVGPTDMDERDNMQRGLADAFDTYKGGVVRNVNSK